MGHLEHLSLLTWCLIHHTHSKSLPFLVSKKQETVQKDSKGRHLRREETQRKNGRYCFKYVDAKGRTRCAYSWTLTTRNLTPKGKKTGSCLRELEKEIQRDLFDNVAPDDMTVYERATRRYSTTLQGTSSARAVLATSRLSRPKDGSSTSKTSMGSVAAPFAQYAGS